MKRADERCINNTSWSVILEASTEAVGIKNEIQILDVAGAFQSGTFFSEVFFPAIIKHAPFFELAKTSFPDLLSGPLSRNIGFVPNTTPSSRGML
jgi:hypothetical protein